MDMQTWCSYSWVHSDTVWTCRLGVGAVGVEVMTADIARLAVLCVVIGRHRARLYRKLS